MLGVNESKLSLVRVLALLLGLLGSFGCGSERVEDGESEALHDKLPSIKKNGTGCWLLRPSLWMLRLKLQVSEIVLGLAFATDAEGARRKQQFRTSEQLRLQPPPFTFFATSSRVVNPKSLLLYAQENRCAMACQSCTRDQCSKLAWQRI